jgi:hypothetical protein
MNIYKTNHDEDRPARESLYGTGHEGPGMELPGGDTQISASRAAIARDGWIAKAKFFDALGQKTIADACREKAEAYR